MIRLPFYLMLFITVAAGACWTDQTYQGMINDAYRLVPDNLQWVLTRYATEFYEGQQVSMSGTTSDQLIQAILRDGEAAVRAFTVDMSYAGGSKLLGRTARQIAFLHALLTRPENLKNAYWPTDYAIFIEKNRPHFRIRWHGLDRRPRTAEDLQRILQISASKKEKLAVILEETLNGENKSIAEYDATSAPFGAGAISYSNAVSSIAMTWLYIWDKSGGIR